MASPLMNLEAERLNRGLSRAEFGNRVGLSRESVRRIESGSRPQADTAKRIADFYGVRVTDIWPVKAPDGHDEPVAA